MSANVWLQLVDTAALEKLAVEFDIDEIWLFGSAAKEDREEVGDIDIAILTDQNHGAALLSELQRVFPNARVQCCRGYFKAPNSVAKDKPLPHFVLANTASDDVKHPIFKSITSGTRIWRRQAA